MADWNTNLDLESEGKSSVGIYITVATLLITLCISLVAIRLLFNKPKLAARPTSNLVTAPANSNVAPANSATSVLWEASYENAINTSRQTGKPVMLDFYTDWCGVCKRMDAETYPAPEVVAESQNFVNVRINAEVRTDLARQYNVDAYPTLIFLNANGNTVNRFAGSYPPSRFVMQMQSARSQAG